MAGSSFVYVRGPQQKVWDALTKPEYQKIYWFGGHQESSWKKGAEWKMFMPQNGLTDSGEILESDPPNRVVIKWRNEFRPNLKAEGRSRCVYELAQEGELTKLTVSHTIEKENAQLIEAVSGGWPRILSSLQAHLETGKAHGDTRSGAGASGVSTTLPPSWPGLSRPSIFQKLLKFKYGAIRDAFRPSLENGWPPRGRP